MTVIEFAAMSNREFQQLAVASIRNAQAKDPFAPVTLLVPGAAQGWEFRRQLVTLLPDGHALANVRIVTAQELMVQCARAIHFDASDDRLVRSIAVEQLLASDTGPLQSAAHHKDTAQLLTRLADELAWCELSESHLKAFRSLTTTTSTAAIEFVRRMRSELPSDIASRSWQGIARRLTPDHASSLATDLGTVIVVEQRLPVPLRQILDAIAGTGREVVLLRLSDPSPFPETTRVLSCPDPVTEVGIAVREVATWMSEGVPPQRIAVLYSIDDPYAALLDAELAAAGIGWRGPTADALATLTLPRATTLFAAMAAKRTSTDSGISRKDLMHWFAIGSLTLEGERINVSHLRTFIRDESLYGDARQWRRVLADFGKGVAPEAAQEDPRAAKRARSVASAERLLTLINALDAALERIASAPTWQALGEATYAALELFHMDPRWSSPDEDERSSVAMLQELLLRSLPRIDRLEGQHATPCSQLPQLLERQFLGRRTRHGKSSVGIHVGPISSSRGLVFDRIALIGAQEGLLPTSSSGNVLLPDDGRIVLRADVDDLPTSLEQADTARTQLQALLAGTAAVTVTYPRAGITSASDGKVSWYFADFEEIKLRSGAQALSESEAPATPTDLAIRDILSQLQLPATLLPQLVAAEAWHQPVLGTTFGSVPSSTMHGKTISASGVELFLHCPYNYFVSQVLRVSTDQYSDDIDIISQSDFGTLLHKVFEDFVTESLTTNGLPEFGGGWPTDAQARLERILEEHVDEARSRGMVGWLPAWERQYEMVRESLGLFFMVDHLMRSDGSLRPAQPEQAFGIGDSPSVALDVDDETTVYFRGYIDRVDVSENGGTVGIVDYKSGKPDRFEASMTATSLDKRDKVQDLVYDLAARQLHPEVTKVNVNFLFFPNDGSPKLVSGQPIDRESVLLQIMRMMQEAATQGLYPPRSTGAFDYCPTCKLLGRRAVRVTQDEDEGDDDD